MPSGNRKQLLAGVSRVVLKIGSGVLTRRNGLNFNVVEDLAADVSFLRRKGTEVIIVSSGAIAAGMHKAGIGKRPGSLSEMQALAALGQSTMIRVYEEAFARHGHRVAQILLTRDDLTNRRRYLNARNTLFTLLSWGTIPIINENDTVVADEIKFGDNDNLSAMVTNLTGARLLINLTNTDGLYDRDPRRHREARLISRVEKIDRKIVQTASAIPGFLGTGGMASKVAAARKVAAGGVPTIIANGLVPGIVREIFAGKEVGTLFVLPGASLSRKRQWIAFTHAPRGELVIDAGAERALLHNGKSLLPSGVRSLSGRFSIGDSVIVKNDRGERVAVGVVNYGSVELAKIIGAKTAAIESILGYRNDDEVIHRDNLVIGPGIEAQL